MLIKSATEIIDALGGNIAVGRLTSSSAKAVSNWRAFDRLPPNTYLLVKEALLPWAIPHRTICGLCGCLSPNPTGEKREKESQKTATQKVRRNNLLNPSTFAASIGGKRQNKLLVGFRGDHPSAGNDVFR